MLGTAPDSTTVTLEETRIISGGSIIVYGVTVENSGALGAIEVIFTNTAGTEILSIAVPANKTFHYKPTWVADNGLRIIGLRDSGVKVTVKHNDDIAPLAAEAYADIKALDFAPTEYLYNASGQKLGFANEWSIQLDVKPGSDSTFMGLLRTQPTVADGSQSSTISIYLQGDAANDPLRIGIVSETGVLVKDFSWLNAFVVGTKVSYIFTWDGTDVLCYIDGVLTAPDILSTDNPGTVLADHDRRVSIASVNGSLPYTGTIHSTSIWDVVLTQAEVTALQNGGSPQSFDNRFNLGGYTSKDNLQHYWRHGGDASDIGRDYGQAAILIDVGDDAVGVTVVDIVDY